jgi:hypothetical protein
VLREVCILRRISHPGIIQLKGAFVQPSSTGIASPNFQNNANARAHKHTHTNTHTHIHTHTYTHTPRTYSCQTVLRRLQISRYVPHHSFLLPPTSIHINIWHYTFHCALFHLILLYLGFLHSILMHYIYAHHVQTWRIVQPHSNLSRHILLYDIQVTGRNSLHSSAPTRSPDLGPLDKSTPPNQLNAGRP